MQTNIPYTRYEAYQPKRIALFCDGTWQSLRADRRTNVAKAAMAVERFGQDGRHQITYYDDGVGALDLGWRRMVAGATGAGLDNRILAAYRFLTLNYEPGDEVYVFGFSRGAYTVRSLAGLIRTCGILRREYAHREGEAMELYRRRADASRAAGPGSPTRDFPEAIDFRLNFSRAWINPQGEPPADPAHPEKGAFTMAFMGVWDTVGTLGVPSVWGMDKRKYQFHDTQLGAWVRRARHAVAIDETRTSFKPTLWDTLDAPPNDAGTSRGGHPDAQQRWFPGDHGGVGGGHAAEGLSAAALVWIIDEAQAGGLVFKASIVEEHRSLVEPLRTPLHEQGLLGAALGLVGKRWRRGLSRLEDVDAAARRRWLANRSYRPQPLKPLREDLEKWRTHGDLAG